MNSIANTISLMARQASIRRRTGWWTQAGAMLDGAQQRQRHGGHHREQPCPTSRCAA